MLQILKKSKKSRARLGLIKTRQVVLRTPAFWPVATQAAIKTLDTEDIKQLGFEGILCNTYHLMLRPGGDLIQKMGGLHKFMNFQGVVATDSGGFQVFSLGKGLEQGVGKILLRRSAGRNSAGTAGSLAPCSVFGKELSSLQNALVKIREEGVYFKSHLDGSAQFLSPEKSMRIQRQLGADIIFAFDQPSSPLDDYRKTEAAMRRTHNWAIRCLEQRTAQNSKVKNQKSKLQFKSQNLEKQILFGIIQGGKYKQLRQASAKFIGSLDFDGIGIGGSFGGAYGDSKKNMRDVLDWTIPLLPDEKPRHLLGIGHLDDIAQAVKQGVDLFDCVHPTRLARHGEAITKHGNLNLSKSQFLSDKSPLEKNCQCLACQNYSRSYICHLFRAGEMTAQRLLTLHNLYFFKNFMDDIRERIECGKL